MRMPTTLWHYTDQAGLLGIIDSQAIRLGDVKYLNDRTELLYARRIVSEYLNALAEGTDELLRAAAVFAGLPRSGDAVYVASMSEVCDSISQWQRYGGDGFGYCIGFDATALADGLRVGERRLYVDRVLYDKKRQHAAIRATISRFLRAEPSLVRDMDVKHDEWQRLRPVALSMRIEEVIVRVKNPFFEDEREWRFVFSIQKAQRSGIVQFGTRGPYIKPYVNAVAAIDDRPLPISQVICGPRLDMSMAAEPLLQLLENRGLTNVKVQQSPLAEVWR